ncbi:hypothetical protein ILUMI_05451 [Ignelater luminosus]|uniref:PiggyBac transposable element-derived protein domain-containing protein n=1 Tax=Ignelater luminosus TaxID=2038154 RepID=A0A8K0GIN3_IGNLU|nr:hypothetical protein ILUMI_05451 [Ignelater luminosus]
MHFIFLSFQNKKVAYILIFDKGGTKRTKGPVRVETDYIIYAGSDTNIDEEEDLGVLGSVVTPLMKPYLGKRHRLFADNWYTTPLLANHFHGKRTSLCGPVKANLLNSFAIYKVKTGSHMTLADFQLELIRQLLQIYVKEEKPKIGRSSTKDLPTRLAALHFPKKIPGVPGG